MTASPAHPFVTGAFGLEMVVNDCGFESLRSPHLAGQLAGPDHARFMAHLKTCPLCRRAVQGVQRGPGAQSPARPGAPGAAPRRRRPVSAGRPSAGVWTTVGIVILLTLGAYAKWNIGARRRERREQEAQAIRKDADQAMNGVQEVLAKGQDALREAELVKQGLKAEIFGEGAPHLRPFAVMHWKDRELLVWGHRLPPAGEGKAYALWAAGPDGKARPVGLFRPDASGQIHALQTVNEPLPPETVFTLTEEPSTGSPQPTGTVQLRRDAGD